MTTDDEDYIDPTNYEEPEILNSADSVSEETSSSNIKLTNQEDPADKPKKELKKSKISSSSSSSLSKPIAKKEFSEKNSPIDVQSQLNPDLLPTDMSDSSSETESNKMDNFVNDAECDSMHEGRQLVHTILPLNIETVFSLLFQKSKFFSEFHRMRNTTNLVQGEWEDQEDGTKKRIQTLTVAITQLVGKF